MPRRNFAIAGSHEKYGNWIRALRNASKERIVLCEKKQDAEALARCGVAHTTWMHLPEYQTLEAIQAAGIECILLFNTNKNSNHKCEVIKSQLQELGVKVNTRFRKLLLASELRDVSNIQKYMQKYQVEERKDLGLY